MIPAILVIWIALAIAFAAGYVLRALLEDADSGDDERRQLNSMEARMLERALSRPSLAQSPVYVALHHEALHEDECSEVDPESRHPLNVPILILALIPFVLSAACLPRIETVTVQECELAPLEARPSLPAVNYTERGDLLCLDTENQMKALEREVRLKEYGNFCEAAYTAAQKRCEVRE